MILADEIDPCQQVRHAIVRHLRGLCGGFARPIPETQVRGILDVSGEPKDSAGVVVACADLGEHWGASNRRILVDVNPRVVVFTHINEDADGSVCNALVSDVRQALQGLDYSLDGWRVAWVGNWTTGEYTLDGSFRQCELSATMPLQKVITA